MSDAEALAAAVRDMPALHAKRDLQLVKRLGPVGDGDDGALVAHGDEWIVLCESQTNAADCEAVAPGVLDGETFRCESLIIVRTSEPDCISTANDSRCFAVSETQPAEPGYILTESGDSQVWLVESPGDVAVHGSAIASCTLAGDGVTWTPDAVCECAGKVTDDEGGW